MAVIDIWRRGQPVAPNCSTAFAGETQFVTDRSGPHRFIIVGYNQAGQPLHFEIESIEIPGIPGIN